MIVALLVVVLGVQDYDRDDWSHWAVRDCVSVRDLVLMRDSRIPVATTRDGCQVLSGEWVDPYSGMIFTAPGNLDIDHLVPLREAHDSGAASWSTDDKALYANDLRDPNHLMAVSARLNRQKGAKDPAGWMPPNRDYHCEYVRHWIGVKGKYRLEMDGDEVHAIADEFARHKC